VADRRGGLFERHAILQIRRDAGVPTRVIAGLDLDVGRRVGV
jgi:hypothetical protein